MKLWCFEDSRDWGSELAKAASARGHDARLFDDPRKPDSGYAFLHMHQHPQTRSRDKRFMQILNMNPNLTLIPDYRASRLFDDKIEQACELSKWLPRTYVAWSPGAARSILDRGLLSLPLISKSTEGASSNNVRMVRTLEDARQEIRFAFSDLGIKAHYGQKQHGYLLWQEFLDGNSFDVRVVAIGDLRLVLRRFNRDDRPMASGSGKYASVKAISHNGDKEICGALAKANAFLEETGHKWLALDLIFDHEKQEWILLEMSVNFTMAGYQECDFLEKNGAPAGYHASRVWEAVVMQIENGVFD